ncbi:MAG: hypothetical protein QY314_01780 [Candidatus Dojkabacteria bacterium]|nr:MAG: hypothetical protein QY314_01780 [Candidatus Dojkabacteria bacterium]
MKKLLAFFITLFASLLFIVPVFAQDPSSTNYQLKDPSFGAVAGEGQSANYRAYLSMDEFVNDVRFTSSNYQARAGVVNTWMANIPLVHCFETTSAGSTDCADGDLANGMVALCGQGGCFDRARVEIDPQGNPSDTLYSLQITTDNTWATWNYVDGTTFLVESAANHDLADYLTETAWESTVSNFNVYGLEPGTMYYVRFTALHGDFTESMPGPHANTTTAEPQIAFDLDIADTSGISTENGAPYTISLGGLFLGEVTTASNLIWLDIGTNAIEGVTVNVKSQYGGLFSSTGAYTLPSVTADLSSTHGYGIQEYSSAETYLGPLTVVSSFTGAGNNVGQVSDSDYGTKLAESTSPLYQGRLALYVKARPEESSPAATDYTDSLRFLIAADL